MAIGKPSCRSAWRSAGVVVSLLLLTQLTACSTDTAADSPHRDTYAYATKTELVVMRGGKPLTRAPIRWFSEYGGIVNTDNGRFFALVSDPPPDVTPNSNYNVLTVIDSDGSGVVKQSTCESCTGVVAIGQSEILVGPHDNEFTALLRYDLSREAVPTRVSSTLDVDQRGRLLTGSQGVALAVRESLSIGDEEAYYTVRRGGSSTKITSLPSRGMARFRATYHSPFSYGRAAVMQLNDGNVQFAASIAQAGTNSAECAADSPVLILSTQSNDVTLAKTSPVAPPAVSLGVNGGIMTDDLWWENGELHAVFEVRSCRSDGNRPNVLSSTEWRFKDFQWQKVSDRQLRTARTLADGSRAYVESGGQLYLERDGGRTKIADDVVAVSAQIVRNEIPVPTPSATTTATTTPPPSSSVSYYPGE